MNSKPLKLIVFQHIDVEHPGIFCDFLKEDGITWDTVELDVGDQIPELEQYDALIVMGGPMDVWEEDKHPWLIDEKAAIRRAVIDLKLPYLGFCLGHQLLASALGGKVGPMTKPEVGILEIELTTDGEKTPLFAGVNQKIKCLQWHGAEVSVPPANSKTLARSKDCAIQALQIGDTAFSMQCHVELTSTTVSDWGAIPEYEKSLEQTLGTGALSKLDSEASMHMTEFNETARTLYNNFRLLL